MKPTHYFTGYQGERYNCVLVAPAWGGGWHVLCQCNDGETWMKEPVFAVGVLPITSGC